jgi:ABC-type multidrug transport system ATPase subunit
MIRLEGIVKEYRAAGGAFSQPVRALDEVTLDVAPGAALAVIGLNGAGKSTLLRMLLGYTRPTSGTVTVDGMPPRRYTETAGIAYVPENIAIPEHWTVRGAMRAYAALGNLGSEAGDRVDWSIDRLGLDGLADRKVRALSKGNLQRLGIAQALLADRRVMILDEPTGGLDPVWLAELRAITAAWRAADPARLLLIASHDLSEVERLADRAVILHRGRLRHEIDLRAAAAESLETQFLRLVTEWDAESAA